MASITQSNRIDLAKITMALAKNTPTSGSYEASAQHYCSELYRAYSDAIVLTRMFVMRPFHSLPSDISDFTSNLAQSAQVDHLVRDDLPVLALVGTHGMKHEWNRRQSSGGHKGIPLAGEKFIREVPMMMALFLQTYGRLDWLDNSSEQERRKISGKASGMFYVEDAAKVVDERNRKVIAAQDFVAAHDVKTVFGVGGGYVDGSFLVSLTFTREHFDKQQAEAFVPSIHEFRSRTFRQLSENRVFGN